MDAASHALYAGITRTKGGDISVSISTNNVEVAKELINKLGGKVCIGIGLALGAFLVHKYFKPLVEDAVRNGFGGERDDQEVQDIRRGSLQVLLHCFTDERFLEVLEEIESGRMKERLRKEFFDIGIETENLIVEIENTQEVNKTKEAISKRKDFSHPTTHASMATAVPQKNIDEINSLREMIDVFELLHIDCDEDKLNLKEMKKKAKEKIKEQSSNRTTGFSLISKAKEDDKLKRDKLEDIYSEVNDCLKDMGHDVISTLNPYFNNRDIMEVLGEQRDRLKKRDYHLLVAGESSAGKSSLINLILGEDLLPNHVLSTTSPICELKYGKERQLVVHYKYDIDRQRKLPPRRLPLKTEEESGKSYQEQIAPFVHLNRMEGGKGSICEKVEIFWPHELLQKGVVIIDSPGLGQSDLMDEVLMNYLPNAFAFIYVIDLSHAGGLQQDLKGKLMKILEKVQSLEGGTQNCKNLAECSLFVCNKWDQVKEREQDRVKRYVLQTLSECWQDANLDNQIMYMSVLDAIKAQQYGTTTPDFNDLLESLQQMILRAINTRLYNHWKWLDFVLYLIFKLTYFYNRGIQSTRQKTRERMDSIEIHIADIEKKEQEVREEMEARLKDQTKFFFSKLNEYIHSPEFKTKFCTWTGCLLPMSTDTWVETKSHIMKSIEYRFKELLIEWEFENRVCAEIHKQLVEEFLERLNLLEDELEGVVQTTDGAEKEIDYSNIKSPLPMPAKILIGAAIPVWVPVGVVSLIIGMPVLGVIAMSNKVSNRMKLSDYRNDPCAYLEKRSEKFLASLKEDDVYGYAEWQMKKTTEVLTNYTNSIPKLIVTKRKMVSKLRSETRNQNEVIQQYTPIQQKSLEVRKNMIPLGIKLCPTTVDASDLDWKEDMDSCIGEGEFSRVYRGKLKNGGRITTQDPNLSLDVVVKVFKQPFDYPNLRLYLNEEMEIRHLDHKNVVKFFGAMKVNISYQSKEHKFVFVRTFCQANLRSVIFNDKSVTPAQASNISQAIDAFLTWAMEIADGLNYIHERGLVHRHLKLGNILMSKDGRAMITDIGILGQFKKTEKSIIYLAPEVLADLETRRKEADIYSYGITLWEMWHGIQAFTELMPLNKTRFEEKIALGYRPIKFDTTIVLPGIQNIMEGCWHSLAFERPRAKECYDAFQNILESLDVTDDTSDESSID